MSEVAGVASVNPFDPANHKQGGGLWDGRTVTITASYTETQRLTNGDGTPVIDDRTKVQSVSNVWVLKGIADDDDKERFENYSAGKLLPTPDGQGFKGEDGGVPVFHVNSNVSKLTAALKAAGYDLSQLWDAKAGRQNVGALVGARFVFKAVAKLDSAGKPIKDKKGYNKMSFYPNKFVGVAAGVAASAPTAKAAGNGHAAGDALSTKAEGAVLGALVEGPLVRADLVRKLAQALAGDADSNAIIGLAVRDDWHKGKPWKWDGITASL